MKKVILMLVTMYSVLASAEAQQPRLEPLYGFLQNQGGVVFQVFSGGCTSKQSFSVDTVVENGVLQVSLNRQIPDYCRAFFFYGTTVYFTYEELGIQPGQRFEIQNNLRSTQRANF